MSTLIYLHAKLNHVPLFFFLNGLFQLFAEARKILLIFPGKNLLLVHIET